MLYQTSGHVCDDARRIPDPGMAHGTRWHNLPQDWYARSVRGLTARQSAAMVSRRSSGACWQAGRHCSSPRGNPHCIKDWRRLHQAARLRPLRIGATFGFPFQHRWSPEMTGTWESVAPRLTIGCVVVARATKTRRNVVPPDRADPDRNPGCHRSTRQGVEMTRKFDESGSEILLHPTGDSATRVDCMGSRTATRCQ